MMTQRNWFCTRSISGELLGSLIFEGSGLSLSQKRLPICLILRGRCESSEEQVHCGTKRHNIHGGITLYCLLAPTDTSISFWSFFFGSSITVP